MAFLCEKLLIHEQPVINSVRKYLSSFLANRHLEHSSTVNAWNLPTHTQRRRGETIRSSFPKLREESPTETQNCSNPRGCLYGFFPACNISDITGQIIHLSTHLIFKNTKADSQARHKTKNQTPDPTPKTTRYRLKHTFAHLYGSRRHLPSPSM